MDKYAYFILFCISSAHTVATFTFTPPSFAASEADDSVSVCASLSDSTQLARSIMVTLEAAEQSAQGTSNFLHPALYK